MTIYLAERYDQVPENVEFPVITLVKNSWNDFGFTTAFDVYRHTSRVSFQKLGRTRILHRGHTNTEIPMEIIDVLPNDFCSIGVSLDFYSNLFAADREDFLSVLETLNDVSVKGHLIPLFMRERAWKESLFRGESRPMHKIDDVRGFIARNLEAEPLLNFEVHASIPGFDDFHKVTFDLTPVEGHGIVPHRVTALIGENGTGKTQFLRQLALSLANIDVDHTRFYPDSPYFSKILAISYSIFDQFPPDSYSKNTNYIYCGALTATNVVSKKKIRGRMASSVRVIWERARIRLWRDNLSKFMDEDTVMELEEYYETSFSDEQLFRTLEDPTAKLSSGQNILLLVFTDLIANIEPRSLVLLDEPETHLHPQAILGVVDLLVEILEKFNSYAVISTHSPIILQYIPSRNVRIFRKDGTIPTVMPLGVESFGEDLTSVLNDVYRMRGVSPLVQSKLEQLRAVYSYDQVIEIFRGRLSLSAMALLSSFYPFEDDDRLVR